MKRKHYGTFGRNLVQKTITDIKVEGTIQGRCITVSNPNGLYITNDFIVTHNSWWLCETRLVNCYLYPGYKSFIGREELKRLMQSTYITWTKVCTHHKIPQSDWHLNGQHNYIEFKNGSRIDLLDLKYLPSDPLYERFGSLEYSDGAIEEAGEVNFLSFDVLKSRIGRHLNRDLGIRPTIAITGNPKKNWTYNEFYKPWKTNVLPDNHAFIQALYTDNPHTAEEYGKQLASISDKATKERLMYGNWEYDDDPSTMISYDNIIDLFTNNIIPKEDRYIIADIARYGKDSTTITLWKGLNLVKVMRKFKQGLETTENDIKNLAFEEKVPYSHILIDEDGIGGGVVDHLQGVKGFVANTRQVFQGSQYENYKNLKTQCAYMLADKVNNHEIKVSTQDEKIKELIIEELEQLKRKDADKEGRLEIEPKDHIKEMIGRSPDILDNFIMRMLFEIQKPSSQVNINYKQPQGYFRR